jgi:hypothetical protein
MNEEIRNSNSSSTNQKNDDPNIHDITVSEVKL